MKKKILQLFFILNISIITVSQVSADGALVAFYRVAKLDVSMEEAASKVKTALKRSDFKITGEYHPGKEDKWYVITFTRNDLLRITMNVGDRGVLASMLRVGLLEKNGKIEVSLLNPSYLFISYLRDNVSRYEETLNAIQMDVMMTLGNVGDLFTPFGAGSLTEMELKDFRYMSHMPGFDDPVILKKFGSFGEAVRAISGNLQAQREGTYKVYEQINRDKKIAVFGVGLRDERLGEDKFLTELGEDHLAALPYELIVKGRTASILHGRYRFPLYWSDLSMLDYRKINRTVRDIEYMMKRLTE